MASKAGVQTGHDRAASMLIGCAPGCILLILVALIGGAFAIRASLSNLEVISEELRQTVRVEFAALKTEGKIPEAHQPFYDEALAESQRPEVGYFGLLLYVGGLIAPLQDGDLSEADWELAQEVRKFLQETPAPSFWAYGDYVAMRPHLQQIVEEHKERHHKDPPE